MQQILIQVMMALIGVIGFSVMFNIHGYKIFLIGVGGSITWILYRIVFHSCNDKVISCFAVTIIIAVFAEVLARIIKTPVILLLVPMLVPLIPGSDLYYMMSSIVLRNTASVSGYGFLLAGEAGAIAFGIIIVTTVTQIIVRTIQYFSKEKCSLSK